MNISIKTMLAPILIPNHSSRGNPRRAIIPMKIALLVAILLQRAKTHLILEITKTSLPLR
jgi:hypothetical protein